MERADLLGLAQLYQIRGRIGRSDAHAYAFLFHPDEAVLTEEAVARLSTLADYTELGSGFKIAMRDLEIRGAGDLLGEEQSGHIAAVGFEMYAPMLEEAVRELQGERGAVAAPCAWTCPSPPTCRPSTSPTRRPRSTSTGASRGPSACASSAT